MRTWLIAILLCTPSSFIFAAVRPLPGTYTVKGMLTLQHGEVARLYVNPLSRSSYTFILQNPNRVAKMLGKEDFVGQAEVTVEVFNPGPYQAPAVVKAAKEIVVKKLPVYDGALEVVPAGK